ncbi:MAG: dephospho-CoA kinase [Pseudomonadota bacterium]
MITIGLTGSIGMGKSTVSAMFAEFGAAIWDADAAVHRLYAKNGAAVDPLKERFPQAVVDAAVDRNKLSELVFGDPVAMQALESIVHPLVAADRFSTWQKATEAASPAIVLDIPLLFETGGDQSCDVTVVVSAPTDVQRTRVLARPNMTVDKFEAILKKQMPDEEKQQRADYVIPTGGSIDETRDAVKHVWNDILKKIDTSND